MVKMMYVSVDGRVDVKTLTIPIAIGILGPIVVLLIEIIYFRQR